MDNVELIFSHLLLHFLENISVLNEHRTARVLEETGINRDFKNVKKYRISVKNITGIFVWQLAIGITEVISAC